jgi:hypothetical protein
MLGYEIDDVSVDDNGMVGTAQMRVRKPLAKAEGQIDKELSFADHWELIDGQWRRQGTTRDEISMKPVPAKGVRRVTHDPDPDPGVQFNAPRFELPEAAQSPSPAAATDEQATGRPEQD